MATAHDTQPGRGIPVRFAVRDLAPGTPRAEADLDGVRALLRAYASALDALGQAVCARGFEDEVLGLPGEYAAPGGRLIVAEEARGAGLAGVVALRRLTRATGEMNRLYVCPAFRASGLGRELAVAAVAAARAIGYERLVLDTLPTMVHAIALYRDLGFQPIARYNDNHSPGAIFLEQRLV